MTDYLLVAIIGFLVGSIELAARYRDNPWGALRSTSSSVYVLVNLAASLLAFFFISDVFDWSFGFTEPEKIRWIRVLVSGMGAMVFFRSSLFTLRIGDRDISIGPGIILQVFLELADRGVDRNRAQNRSIRVSEIMKGVLFSKASISLRAYCFALMQNVSSEEQATFGKQLAQLKSADMPDEVKVLALGLSLLNIVGDAALLAAVKSLESYIKLSPPAVAPSPGNPSATAPGNA
jgi:hypothetical protein